MFQRDNVTQRTNAVIKYNFKIIAFKKNSIKQKIRQN